MKTKNLIYFGAAALIVYFLFKKKKTTTTTANEIITEAANTANDILTNFEPVIELPNGRPVIDLLPPPKEVKPLPVEPLPVEPDSNFFEFNAPYMPADTIEPFAVTQSQTINYPQISPTPATVLSPEQLIRFNTDMQRGQLMGVC